ARPEGTSDYADEVTLSRKGAKSQTGSRKLRSTGTKAKGGVARSDESQASLIKKLKAHARHLEEKLDARAGELAEARKQLANPSYSPKLPK
ncbi:MAG TPA: hypothetical protein VLE24_00155, partial [Methyloceanibacter sp.]|nr:hypothetical protein [Methyloceanibacter sp.]